MTTTITTAFVAQYQAELKLLFQQMGSLLMSTVQKKTGVVGSTCTFQRMGTGTATTKARHGVIPPMNVAHAAPSATLTDYYAGDWVDKLDETKIKHDERMGLAKTGAAVLGRQADTLIYTALDGTTNSQDNSANLTLTEILTAMTTLGNNDAFEQGEMFFICDYSGWAELLKIQQFSDADYRGPSDLPFLALAPDAKTWMGTTFMPVSVLDGLTSGNDHKAFWYNRRAVGHAVGADITADITWHGDRASHFINHMMSMGSVLIDDTGVVEIIYDITA